VVAHQARGDPGRLGDPSNGCRLEPGLAEVLHRGVPDAGSGGQILRLDELLGYTHV
jgi:hypothetical protein